MKFFMRIRPMRLIGEICPICIPRNSPQALPLWSGAGDSKYSKPLNGWLSEVSSVSTIRTRMEKAAHLLAATFLSVKEIMANVRYDNRANFLRRFEEDYDVTLTEYRRRAFARER